MQKQDKISDTASPNYVTNHVPLENKLGSLKFHVNSLLDDNFSQNLGGSNMPFNFAMLQTKLEVSQPGDIYEQEADRIAEQVMKMPYSGIISSEFTSTNESLERKCAGCKIKSKEEGSEQISKISISRKPYSSSLFYSHDTTNLQSKDFAREIGSVNHSRGLHLDKPTQKFMQKRFVRDFSKIRVHTDSKAAKLAHSVNALAFTVGNDIVFGEGHYTPETIKGKYLLAHELIHTIQQSRLTNMRILQRQNGPAIRLPETGLFITEGSYWNFEEITTAWLKLHGYRLKNVSGKTETWRRKDDRREIFFVRTSARKQVTSEVPAPIPDSVEDYPLYDAHSWIIVVTQAREAVLKSLNKAKLDLKTFGASSNQYKKSYLELIVGEYNVYDNLSKQASTAEREFLLFQESVDPAKKESLNKYNGQLKEVISWKNNILPNEINLLPYPSTPSSVVAK